MAYAPGYNRTDQPMARFSLRIERTLLKEVDAYGIPAGCHSRNNALLRLIKLGLESVQKETVEEGQLGGTSSSTVEQ